MHVVAMQQRLALNFHAHFFFFFSIFFSCSLLLAATSVTNAISFAWNAFHFYLISSVYSSEEFSEFSQIPLRLSVLPYLGQCLLRSQL